MSSTIACARLGDGPRRVLVFHDWFCDRTEWDAALPYLSLDRFSYAFADLRGYGESRAVPGAYTLEEAVADALALASSLGWERFAIVGHSMSTTVTQRLLQLAPERVERAVLVTPVPPTGAQLDAATLAFFRSFALGDDAARYAAAQMMWGNRLSDAWTRFKLRRWRQAALPEASAAYLDMWGSTDISAGARAVKTPILVITGAEDAPPIRRAAMEVSLLPYYENASITELAQSAHYPMQEQPPLTATLLERFLDPA